MPANTAPIFTRLGDIQWAIKATVANTTTDLTGAGTIYLIFTADATNGGYVQKIRFRPLPGGNNSATVARIWINNGAATTTDTNNTLYDEISLASTVSNPTGALAVTELPMNIALPAGYRLYVTLGSAVSPGYDITTIAGKY
jgi:hypothetical protein